MSKIHIFLLLFAVLAVLPLAHGLVLQLNVSDDSAAQNVNAPTVLGWQFLVPAQSYLFTVHSANLDSSYLVDVNREELLPFDENFGFGFTQPFLLSVPGPLTFNVPVLSQSCAYSFIYQSKDDNSFKRLQLQGGSNSVPFDYNAFAYLIASPESLGSCDLQMDFVGKSFSFRTDFLEAPDIYNYMSTKFTFDADLNCTQTWEDKTVPDKICYTTWHTYGCSDAEIFKFDRLGCAKRLIVEKDLRAVDLEKMFEDANKQSQPEIVKAFVALKEQIRIDDENRAKADAKREADSNTNTLILIGIVCGVLATFAIALIVRQTHMFSRYAYARPWDKDSKKMGYQKIRVIEEKPRASESKKGWGWNKK